MRVTRPVLLVLSAGGGPLAALAATLTTLFTVPGPTLPGSWFENVAVRPNGNILATRGDAPEIWQIDPATGSGALLVNVTGAYNLTGIAEVRCRPLWRRDADADAGPGGKGGKGKDRRHPRETYVFGSSHIPAPFTVAPGSAKVWTLTFGPGGTPAVALLAAMPSAGFINGVASWDAGRVLLSDTELERVYLMDVDTGSYTTPLTGLAGINGIQTRYSAVGRGHGGHRYVYRADHLLSQLSRIPVDADAVATGPAEVLATGTPIDDFAIRVDATGYGKAYIAAMYDNEVVEVDVAAAPSSGPGASTLLASDLTGTGVGLVTVAAFGRRSTDSNVLYATAGQGGGNAAIVKIEP
ncbi:hypothetical protein VTJ83DRAFT_785 [Remersonia thermophila]|uniref:Uncharacterized protein n=1 Tax=Remersonia thermophila TaxID=72144 RepID=A0ABR4DMT9_9PEZI